MALSVVQSAPMPDLNPGGTITLTLTDTPVPGNILVAFCGYSQFNAARTIGTPGGWSKVDDVTGTSGAASDSLATFWHLVQSGDGKTWTWTISDAGDACSGAMYEITGADPVTPINQHATHNYSSAASTLASTSVTPSVIGCLGLAAWSLDGQAGTFDSVTAGWTRDQFGVNTGWHDTAAAHRNTLTTDTTTAITCSGTFSFSSAGVGESLLIAPAVSFTATPGSADGAGLAYDAAAAQITIALYAGTAAGITGSWVNTGAATGITQGNYATWTDTAGGTSAVLELAGFGAQVPVPSGSSVTQVNCVVRHGETPASAVASVTAQAYSGTTPVGSPQPLTAADAVHEDTVTFTGLTWADLADLRVRVTVTRD